MLPRNPQSQTHKPQRESKQTKWKERFLWKMRGFGRGFYLWWSFDGGLYRRKTTQGALLGFGKKKKEKTARRAYIHACPLERAMRVARVVNVLFWIERLSWKNSLLLFNFGQISPLINKKIPEKWLFNNLFAHSKKWKEHDQYMKIEAWKLEKKFFF